MCVHVSEMSVDLLILFPNTRMVELESKGGGEVEEEGSVLITVHETFVFQFFLENGLWMGYFNFKTKMYQSILLNRWKVKKR